MTANLEKPKFLDGVFVPRRLGFSLTAEPPIHLLDDRALHDKNYWVVLAALVERAKRGDFENMLQILPCLRASEGDGAFWYACLHVLSNAAPSSVLKKLVTEFHPEIWVRKDLWRIEFVADVLRQSMLLWTVLTLLDIYLEIGDREEVDYVDETRDEPSLILLPVYISELLEEELGPISEAEMFDTDSDYRDLVTRTYEQRCSELGSVELAILKGRAFSIRSIGEDLLDKVTDERVDALEFAQQRMLFESTTGIDCRDFFVDTQLQRLTAAAMLEDFLADLSDEQYEPGVRYFFGHRIPA